MTIGKYLAANCVMAFIEFPFMCERSLHEVCQRLCGELFSSQRVKKCRANMKFLSLMHNLRREETRGKRAMQTQQIFDV
jgi:hypothetical protein